MPPKSSSAGRPRRRSTSSTRSPRSTARKSVGSPPVIKPCLGQSPPLPNPPSDSDMVTANAFSIEDEIVVSACGAAVIATSTQASAALIDDDASEQPPNDGVLRTDAASVLPEENRKNSIVEAAMTMDDDAVMASHETLIQERPEINSVVVEIITSPGPPGGTDGKVATDDVSVSDEAAAAAFEAADIVGAAEGDVASGVGGKTKKVVKRVVKVVKKVIKRVPKRVAKVGNEEEENEDEKVECLTKDGFPVSVENVEPGLTASLIVEDSNANVVSTMAVEETGLDKEVPEGAEMEIEESMGSLEAENGRGNISMEDDPNDDILKDQQLGVTGEKAAIEHLDAKGREDVECGNGTMEVDAGGGEVGGEGEMENDDNTARPGDEVGEGVYLSSEMGAMERRRRRKTEIFIGGLDRDTKEEDIRKVFEEVGEVVEVRLLMNGKTGKNKGYAFVRYASAVDAKRAAEKFSKVEISGKQCGVSLVEGSDTLYLGNIDKKWKDEDVLKLLQDAGVEKIDKVTVMSDPNNSECNRGFAFIEFETSKDAQVSHKKLQKNDVFGKNKKLKVAWAEPLAEPEEEEMLKVKTVFAELIPPTWDEENVREKFKEFGEIENVVLARNLRTSKRKDFAFISYSTREAAIACIESFSSQLTNDDGTKVSLKVSLAKPIPKGKHLKKVPKALSREVPKEMPPTSHGIVKLVDPRNQGRLIIPQHDSYGIQRPSTNAELVQLLREQAARRPLQNNLNTGSVDINYSSPLSARKRPFSTLETHPYLDFRGHTQRHLETSFPIAGSSYHSFFPNSGSASSSYHQPQGGYASQLQFGARSYADSETRDRPDGRSVLYRRY